MRAGYAAAVRADGGGGPPSPSPRAAAAAPPAAMHTFLNRTNALLTFATSTLACLCALAAVTGNEDARAPKGGREGRDATHAGGAKARARDGGGPPLTASLPATHATQMYSTPPTRWST